MPKRIPVELGMEWSEERHAAAARRGCVNLRPAPLPAGSKAPAALYRIEGSLEFVTPGSAPVRGMKEHEGRLFVVAGGSLFEIDSLGNTYNRGAIGGAGRVSMCAIDGYLAISASNGMLYTWNGSALAAVSDGDLPAVGWIEAFDQYIVYGRQDGYGWGISALADARSYDPLDVAGAESQPDKIVTGLRLGRELLLFGETTTESFYNSGAGDFPFDRAPDGVIDVGCAAKYSPARCDNTAYWLAVDAGGYSVRRLEGRTPKRVSTPAIDDLLETAALSPLGADISDAYGFSWTTGGHANYGLGVPVLNRCFVYDVMTGMWETRVSNVAGVDRRWRYTHAAQVFGAAMFGDEIAGRIGITRRNIHTELGDPIPWETVCAPVQFQGRNLTHARLELELDSSPKSTARTVSMAFSDNDGQTWSGEQVRTTPTGTNAPNRCVWTNLGSARSRLYRFKGNGNTPIGLIRSFVDVEVGG